MINPALKQLLRGWYSGRTSTEGCWKVPGCPSSGTDEACEHSVALKQEAQVTVIANLVPNVVPGSLDHPIRDQPWVPTCVSREHSFTHTHRHREKRKKSGFLYQNAVLPVHHSSTRAWNPFYPSLSHAKQNSAKKCNPHLSFHLYF